RRERGGGLTYHDVAAPARAFGRVGAAELAPLARDAATEPLFDLPADFDGRADRIRTGRPHRGVVPRARIRRPRPPARALVRLLRRARAARPRRPLRA